MPEKRRKSHFTQIMSDKVFDFRKISLYCNDINFQLKVVFQQAKFCLPLQAILFMLHVLLNFLSKYLKLVYAMCGGCNIWINSDIKERATETISVARSTTHVWLLSVRNITMTTLFTSILLKRLHYNPLFRTPLFPLISNRRRFLVINLKVHVLQ